MGMTREEIVLSIVIRLMVFTSVGITFLILNYFNFTLLDSIMGAVIFPALIFVISLIYFLREELF